MSSSKFKKMYKDYPIETKVRRNPVYPWSFPNYPDQFEAIGKVFGHGKEYQGLKVLWPNGEWFRYTEPARQLIIVEKPKNWSLPDELFEI